MEDNFYVGTVRHFKRKKSYDEQLVLYSNNGILYTDLLSFASYKLEGYTNAFEDYVIKNTLIHTDPSEHNDDYNYLLMKFQEEVPTKKRKKRTTIH